MVALALIVLLRPQGLLREFRRISVYSSHLKKKEELAEKKHVVPAAHVDSLWPSQPPKSGKTAALGTLKGGQHWCAFCKNVMDDKKFTVGKVNCQEVCVQIES